MADLTLRPGSPEWNRLRQRCLTDLFFFADAVLGFGPLVPLTVPTHRLMCAFVERRTGVPLLDEAIYRMVSVPRGVGKTSCITIAWAIQLALADPETAILIANERQENADAFLGSIRLQFETNELLRALFPDRIPADPKRQEPWAATKLSLLRTGARPEPTFMTIGVGGTATGMHPDHIIADDVISREAMENARAGSWQTMEKVNRWINQLRPLLNTHKPGASLTLPGTRWWQGDSYEHVEASFGYGEAKQFVRLKQPLPDGSTQVLEDVYRVGDLAVFRRPIYEHGACIFPEKYSAEELAKIRVADPELFAANFLNDPTSDLTASFKSTWLRFYTWATPTVLRLTGEKGRDQSYRVADLDCIASIDPAFSDHRSAGHSRQALVVTGGLPEGGRVILHASATNQSLDAFLGDIVAVCQKYRVRKLTVERAGQQLAFILLLRRALQTTGVMLSLEEVSPGGRQKDVRILTLEPYFQRGLLYQLRDQTDLMNEYLTFPKGTYKDLLDALAQQAPFWPAGPSSGVSAPNQQRVDAELSALYGRMGQPSPVTPANASWKRRADGSLR